ncbi:hypothetical protein [Tenebrionibacter intestinalis]|uniref:Uncharacterized protein n=3 Tax=Tenebrionibacter/Tenebrionicola group TaxID=2969848 RepID=A0A8K0XXZ3_9ENTR|nr:hypothetical protein [Tenebrionibacter intestinalis]MBK4715877.1 hypothetical protein [Tenebrionibacter intestinalis]MBV5096636.1 hypothetical protein [Tenebrionicola larvae]
MRGLERLKGAADVQTISALKEYRDTIEETAGGPDAFELLDKLRTQFRVDVKGDRTVLPGGSQAVTERVYNAFTNSLNRSIAKSAGAKDAALWRKGKGDYARMAADATQTRLKNVLNKGELLPETVNAIVYGQYGSDIARLYGKLDDKGKDMPRAAYVSKIADKANGSPQKFMPELDKLSRQANGQVFKTVFSGKHKKEIEGLLTVLQATERASKANVVTQTGITLSAPLRVFGNLSTGEITCGRGGDRAAFTGV